MRIPKSVLQVAAAVPCPICGGNAEVSRAVETPTLEDIIHAMESLPSVTRVERARILLWHPYRFAKRQCEITVEYRTSRYTGACICTVGANMDDAVAELERACSKRWKKWRARDNKRNEIDGYIARADLA